MKTLSHLFSRPTPPTQHPPLSLTHPTFTAFQHSRTPPPPPPPPPPHCLISLQRLAGCRISIDPGGTCEIGQENHRVFGYRSPGHVGGRLALPPTATRLPHLTPRRRSCSLTLLHSRLTFSSLASTSPRRLRSCTASAAGAATVSPRGKLLHVAVGDGQACISHHHPT